MQTATVNVAEYLDQRWKSYEQEVKAFDSRKEECSKAARRHLESIRSLKSQLGDKEELKHQASANGLDTTPLDKDITRIRAELEASQKQHDEQHQLATQPGPVAPYERESVSRFLEHLGEKKLGAEVLPSLEAAASHVTVTQSDLTLDKEGVVIKAHVRFAKHRVGEVSISPDYYRYAKFFRPKPLEWLPSLAGESAAVEEPRHHGEPLRVFIVEDKLAILLPAKYNFHYKRDLVSWNGARQEESVPELVTGDKAPFVLASNLLANALKNAGGTVRLDKTYSDKFLKRICEEIEALTLEKLRWTKNTEYPDSEKVLAFIRDDLSLLAAAPWSDGIRGPWAKLKHTLENGERPRVWRKEYVDHYGLRLRTRDHTWLVGSMFIDRTQQPGKPGEPIEITRDERIGRIGRMHLWVNEYRDE
jgi:hypothetical protein